MTVGPWVVFDQWLQNIADGDSDIFADDVYAALLGDGQAISRSFVGGSADCRYADLTDELPTASGYTVGGIILPSKTVIRTGGSVVLSSNDWQWTITSDIAGVKYCALFNFDSVNQDLICFCDLDVDPPGTNTVTLSTGIVGFSPAAAGGIVEWYQP